jgi:hypothetical protein
MRRLLFAAARGARIEAKSGSEWCPALSLPCWIHDPVYRIHPDDEHLQYGPVSTEIKTMACQHHWLKQRFIPSLALDVILLTPYADRWMTTWGSQSPFERSLALLILAEALADEGL